MAGYIMTFDNISSLKKTASEGVYSTKISIPNNNLWQQTSESTLSDFSTMKEGDNIYLFHKRTIYGVGELVNLDVDCKYLNFPRANEPKPTQMKDIEDIALTTSPGWSEKEQRWVCTFKHNPAFFQKGIDMDAALLSNPDAFKMLRAFEKVSFIKIDDKENQALKSLFLKKFENEIEQPSNTITDQTTYKHKEIKDKLLRRNYKFNIEDITDNSVLNNFLFRRETTLELSLLHQLNTKEPKTTKIFDDWDYLSKQVIASLFKPIQWVDKMDVFGYKYVKQIEGFPATISKYLVAELKKENATKSDVDQLLKYVDWVNNEYALGDYSMIKAFLVAAYFDDEVIEHMKNVGTRMYTTNLRDDRSSEQWSNITLVKYKYDNNLKKTLFNTIEK